MRALADQARTIRLPVHLGDALARLRAAEEELGQALGRQPTPRELADRLRVSPERVEQLIGARQLPISLDAPIGGNEGAGPCIDLVGDEGTGAPGEALDNDLLRADIARALLCLSERERRVIRLRYGFGDGHQHTLAEASALLGISRERVRQIEMEALEKLRAPRLARRLALHRDQA